MSYSEKYFVMYHDVAPNGEIKPSALMRFMQETANHHMRDSKPSYDELYGQGKVFILSRMNIEIRFPLRRYDQIEVDTWPTSKGVTFLRSYQIRRGEELAARATGTWALVDINTKRFFRANEVDLSSYHEEPPLTDTLDKRVVIPDGAKMSYAGSHTVAFTETDLNGHMNNTYYPDILVNFIPEIEKYAMKGMTLQYMSEAKLGAKLDVYVSEPIFENGTKIYLRTIVGDKTNVAAEFDLIKLY